MKLCIIVGARPNFIKAAPLVTAIKKYQKKHKDLSYFILHTGQHFDINMSDVFFNEMNIPKPDYQLDVKDGTTHGRQTGEMLMKVEEVLMSEKPDMVISIGDTNSTLAGALAAAKLNIPISHVEAGLRMYNKTLAEDVNRVVTDHMSTLCFTPSAVGTKHLAKEGFPKSAVWQYGDVMYDALLQFDKIAEKTGKVGIYFASNIREKLLHAKIGSLTIIIVSTIDSLLQSAFVYRFIKAETESINSCLRLSGSTTSTRSPYPRSHQRN